MFEEQDARACSVVLKGRRDACGTLIGLDAAASERACFHSLKTEEKTMAACDVVRGRDRIPFDLDVGGRQPTSAPTGVARAGPYE
jgi:hypothetical protein